MMGVGCWVLEVRCRVLEFNVFKINKLGFCVLISICRERLYRQRRTMKIVYYFPINYVVKNIMNLE